MSKGDSAVLDLEQVPFAQSGRGFRNAKKPLQGFQGCDKNGLNEPPFDMSQLTFQLSYHTIQT